MSRKDHEIGIDGVAPRTWHLAPYGWRFGRYATRSRLERLLRFRLLSRLPRGWLARFEAMGLPLGMVVETLDGVRSFHDWVEAWTTTAQHYSGEARRAERDGDDVRSATALQRAAHCYHVASWFAFEDERVARACRSSANSLFSKSVPHMLPDTRRVQVPWRTGMLPAYLTVPRNASSGCPLVVLLNGVTTSKEELILWRGAYVDHGMAVLALDWPGTGELLDASPPDPDHDDFTDGLVDLATHERGLDPERIVLTGVSLGGAMAVRAAALDRRIAAAIAVTPPYDMSRWLHAAIPLLRDQFSAWNADPDRLDQLAQGFALESVVSRLRAPLLVLGAGCDLLVPPSEALTLASRYGDDATLIWYDHAGHGLYEVLDDWTTSSSVWLNAVFGREVSAQATVPSTRVEEPDEATWSSEDSDAEGEATRESLYLDSDASAHGVTLTRTEDLS
jgi:alpha-beta hydrolase superfamily lysophospholipase